MTTIESVVAESPLPLAGFFGGRAPIARTAVGHAYLAGLSPTARERLMAELQAHYQSEWPVIEKRIWRDIKNINTHGYCVVLREWSEHISGVACPIVIAEDGLVVSMSAGGPSQLLGSDILEDLGERMRDLRVEIERSVGRPGR